MPKFKQVTFELTKFILGTKAEENKKNGEEFFIPEF